MSDLVPDTAPVFLPGLVEQCLRATLLGQELVFKSAGDDGSFLDLARELRGLDRNQASEYMRRWADRLEELVR